MVYEITKRISIYSWNSWSTLDNQDDWRRCETQELPRWKLSCQSCQICEITRYLTWSPEGTSSGFLSFCAKHLFNIRQKRLQQIWIDIYWVSLTKCIKYDHMVNSSQIKYNLLENRIKCWCLNMLILTIHSHFMHLLNRNQ